MENSRQFDRLFGQLRDLEPAEIAPALASMADYHDLPFHHFQAQQYLRQLVDARTRLEAAGEYAQADQRRNAAGYTSELYLPPRDGHDFQRPLWVRDLEGDHDIALMDLRRTLLHSSWMIENLCRDLVAPTIRAAVVTSLLTAARLVQLRLVQQRLVGPGSPSVLGIDVLEAGVTLGLAWIAATMTSLGLARYCRLMTAQLRRKLRADPGTVGQKEESRWNSWAWFVLEWLVIPCL